MPAWLILNIIGLVLVILGAALQASTFLLWAGVVVLVIALIVGVAHRGRSMA